MTKFLNLIKKNLIYRGEFYKIILIYLNLFNVDLCDYFISFDARTVSSAVHVDYFLSLFCILAIGMNYPQKTVNKLFMH